MLHTERAAAGLGDWEVAHTWLTAAADGDINAGPNTTLSVGALALAFALHAAVTLRRDPNGDLIPEVRVFAWVTHRRVRRLRSITASLRGFDQPEHHRNPVKRGGIFDGWQQPLLSTRRPT